MKKIKQFLAVAVVAVAMVVGAVGNMGAAFAASFGVSPTHQKIALVPGQTYYGSFKVTNPAENTDDFKYRIEIVPFHREYDEETKDYRTVYSEQGDYNQIVDWITIENQTGSISPNSSKEIYFIVEVPLNAPAGGQYAALAVSSNADVEEKGNTNIQQVLQFAHLVYAEVAGETVHNTEIVDMNVPSFLFDGNITASVTVKNNGNTHIEEESVLQVFPIFSDEEIFTNEEDTDTWLVTPESTRTVNTPWTKTPWFGIYRVLFSVKIDGEVMGTVEKMVFICPLWLMFVVLAVIIALVVWLVLKSRQKKHAKEE